MRYLLVVAVGGGGGTILPSEIEELQAYGIDRIYSPDDGRHLGLQGMINDVLEMADGFLPAAGLEHLGMVPLRTGHLQTGFGDVVQIPLLSRRQLDTLQRKLVEVLLRDAERHVRFDIPDCEEERLVMVLRQLVERVAGHFVVRHVLVRVRVRTELDSAHAVIRCRRVE